jgi:hypothetical protein
MSGLLIAVAPALPLHTAGKYVAGAYIVFLALVLLYVAIMASRLARTERELTELRRDVELRRSGAAGDSGQAAGDSGQTDREHEPVA